MTRPKYIYLVYQGGMSPIVVSSAAYSVYAWAKENGGQIFCKPELIDCIGDPTGLEYLDSFDKPR